MLIIMMILLGFISFVQLCFLVWMINWEKSKEKEDNKKK